jgi:hypothetical protein
VAPALLFLASALFLTPEAASSATPDAARFAPPFCPYAVQFPAVVQPSTSSAPDGSKIAAVETVIGGMRLSAFCAASGQTASTSAALDPKERAGRVLALVNELQIVGATINDVGPVGPDCSEVHGTLLVNGTSYRILSRLCMRSDSTFIAEAIFSTKTDEENAGSFVASLQHADNSASARVP